MSPIIGSGSILSFAAPTIHKIINAAKPNDNTDIITFTRTDINGNQKNIAKIIVKCRNTDYTVFQGVDYYEKWFSEEKKCRGNKIMDIFSKEQEVLDRGLEYLASVKNGAEFDLDKYEKLLDEYRRILKQLRRLTKISDRVSTDLYKKNLDLKDKINIDMLTGIFNNRYLMENLNRTISTIIRSGGGRLSVMMIDIDNFKKYNETYGQADGDICLKTVAQALEKATTRCDDFIGKYDEDEFVLVMPNTDRVKARFMANNILEKIRVLTIPHTDDKTTSHITVSIGITTGFIIKHTQDGVDLIKRANEAMYISKQDGRNRCTFLEFEDIKS